MNRKSHVLVVDDEAPIRLLLKVVIRSLECEVELCDDGVVAWDLLQARPYDLLVVDLMMPGMTGVELLSRVNRCGLDMPVVVVSGVGLSPDDRAKLSFRHLAELRKPFGIEELMLEIKSALKSGSQAPQPPD